jgi:thioredoxin reductase
VSFFTGRVLKVEQSGSAFNVTLPDQPILSVRKVILAYGVEDPLPDAPGFRELWGSAVYHCPYCHGYEVRDAKLAYVGNATMAHHVLPMLMSLTKDLVLFTNGATEIEPAFREQLKKKNIPLFQDRIASLVHEGKSLRAVKLTSGEIVERTGLFVAPKIPLTLKGSIGEKLGCEKTEMGFYKVELMGKSTVPGVFVAGDIMSMQHSVLGAAASGQLAGSGAVFELTREDFENS